MNHLLLYLLFEIIGPRLKGRRITTVRYIDPVVSVPLAGSGETGYFVAVLSSPGPFCFFAPDDPLDGAGDDVMKRIAGARIAGAPPPRDRIVRLHLEHDVEPIHLSFTLFGSRGKVRVEHRGLIIESLAAEEAGKEAAVSKPPVSLVAIDRDALEARLAGADEDTPRVLGLAAELIECFRRSPEPPDVSQLIAFRDALLAGKASFYLGTRGPLGRVTPLPAGGPASAPPLPSRFGPFTSAEEGCLFAGLEILRGARTAIVRRRSAPIRRHLARRRRLFDSLHQDLTEAETFPRVRKEAEILAAYRGRVKPGSAEVELPDPYQPGTTATIRLDPALSIHEQVGRRFKRAAKLERSRDALAARIQTVRHQINGLEATLRSVDEAAGFAAALRIVDRAVRDHRLTGAKRGRPKPTETARTLRQIDLDARWFVLVGRNNRENDEITFRIAAPDDIWLHAQQAAGSHVVLKSRGAYGNPPATILEAAAGVAAYYSKARHASLVPVIYTRRKYVRKPRGARPGLVKCEREKTVVVEPRLPVRSGTAGGSAEGS